MYKIDLKIFDWVKKYIMLENIEKPASSFNERDIFWLSIGQNVGFEEYGKGTDFQRPVLVLRKFNKRLFLGVPLSTKIKEDNEYYVKYSFQNQEGSALISQIRCFDSKRIIKHLGKMSQKDFDLIKNKVLFMIDNKADNETDDKK